MFLTHVCLGHSFYVYWWAVYSKGFKLVFTINLWKLFNLFRTILSTANISLTKTINPTPFTNVGKTHLLLVNILHIFKCILIPLTIDTSFSLLFFFKPICPSADMASVFTFQHSCHVTYTFLFFFLFFFLNYLTLLAYYCRINYFKILRFLDRMQIIQIPVLIH